MMGYLQEKRAAATNHVQSGTLRRSARGALTSQPLAGVPTALLSSPTTSQLLPISQVKDSRHQEPALHFDAGCCKGLILEQAMQFFMSRLYVTPLVTMQDLLLSQKVHVDRVTSAVSKDHSLFLLRPPVSQTSQAVAKGTSNP